MRTITVTVNVREDFCHREWNRREGCEPKNWPKPCPFVQVSEEGGLCDGGWKEYSCILFGEKLNPTKAPNDYGIDRCDACKKAKV